jgi:hypothetical protein
MSANSSPKLNTRQRRTGIKTVSSSSETLVVSGGKRTKRFRPECIKVSVQGSLRFDDPSAGRSRGRGRPRGKLGATSRRTEQVAEWLLAGEKQCAIAPKVFPNLNKEVAYARVRSFLNRYRREIRAETEALRGKLLQELAAMQERRSKMRGRPLGNLMPKTRERIESAARYSLAGKSQGAIAPTLFLRSSRQK